MLTQNSNNLTPSVRKEENKLTVIYKMLNF